MLPAAAAAADCDFRSTRAGNRLRVGRCVGFAAVLQGGFRVADNLLDEGIGLDADTGWWGGSLHSKRLGPRATAAYRIPPSASGRTQA